MAEKKYLKYNNDVFDTLPSLPQMNSAKSGKHGRAGSHSATPKNLAFQLIRSHLIKKHYESNHRPNLVKASNMSPFKGQMKNDRLLKSQYFDKTQSYQNAIKQKNEVINNINKSKKFRDSGNLVALIPSSEENKSLSQKINSDNYNLYRECIKRPNSLADSDEDSNLLDKIDINTREQLNYTKVDLNKYENQWSRSMDSFYDGYQKIPNGEINRAYNSSMLEVNNINREGLIFHRFHENDMGDIHIHHSKRLILPSIIKRYENMDFSMNGSDFNTNYRIKALNQQALKDLHAKNLSVKDTVSKPFLPDIY